MRASLVEAMKSFILAALAGVDCATSRRAGDRVIPAAQFDTRADAVARPHATSMGNRPHVQRTTASICAGLCLPYEAGGPARNGGHPLNRDGTNKTKRGQ